MKIHNKFALFDAGVLFVAPDHFVGAVSKYLFP